MEYVHAANKPIDIDLAYRLRYERGLALPINAEYDDERVAEIAQRQHVLQQEYNELDRKLKRLHAGGQE